ncbi:hypothetical protein ACJ6U3_23230, partial [Escherichia coli]
MLQIIRGKLVIFLITLCLFVVYLGFDNNSNSDIVFYGHKTPKSVEIYQGSLKYNQANFEYSPGSFFIFLVIPKVK